jgi:hypothetical protein
MLDGEEKLIEIGHGLDALKNLDLPSENEIIKLQRPPYMYDRRYRLAAKLVDLKGTFHEFFA